MYAGHGIGHAVQTNGEYCILLILIKNFERKFIKSLDECVKCEEMNEYQKS